MDHTSDAVSIAVLPFVNMNRDEDVEFFADGVAEDIISALAKLPGLGVVARSSSFQFKGRSSPAQLPPADPSRSWRPPRPAVRQPCDTRQIVCLRSWLSFSAPSRCASKCRSRRVTGVRRATASDRRPAEVCRARSARLANSSWWGSGARRQTSGAWPPVRRAAALHLSPACRRSCGTSPHRPA